MNWHKNIAYLVLLALLISIPFFITTTYHLGVVIVVLLNILLATSIWLILQMGEASVAHAAFAAIGGYIAAALVTSYGFSFWLSLPLGMLAAGAVALIVGFITLRLKSHYFLIVTAAFGEIVRLVFSMIEKPFGGLIGILTIPVPDPIAIPGLPVIEFASKSSFYYIVLVVAVLVVIVVQRLSSSRFGQTLHAIAQADVRAEHVGINIMGYKVTAFVIGSMLAGLTGVIYAFNARCMLPSTFTFWQSIYCLIYVSVGGGTSIAGPILGATVFSLLSQVLRPVQMLEPVIYGLALMICMIFFRQGLLGGIQKLWSMLAPLLRVGQKAKQ